MPNYCVLSGAEVYPGFFERVSSLGGAAFAVRMRRAEKSYVSSTQGLRFRCTEVSAGDSGRELDAGRS